MSKEAKQKKSWWDLGGKQARLEELESFVDSQAQQLAALHEELTAARGAIEMHREQLGIQSKAHKEELSRVQESRQQLEEKHQSHRDAWTGEKKQLQEGLQSLRSADQRKARRVDELEQLAEQLKSTLRQRDEELAQLREELDVRDQALLELGNQRTQQRQLLSGVQLKNEDLRAKNTSLERAMAELQRSHDSLFASQDAAVQAQEALLARCEGLQLELGELEQKRMRENGALERKLKSLQTQERGAREQLARAEQSCQKWEQESQGERRQKEALTEAFLWCWEWSSQALGQSLGAGAWWALLLARAESPRAADDLEGLFEPLRRYLCQGGLCRELHFQAQDKGHIEVRLQGLHRDFSLPSSWQREGSAHSALISAWLAAGLQRGVAVDAYSSHPQGEEFMLRVSPNQGLLS